MKEKEILTSAEKEFLKRHAEGAIHEYYYGDEAKEKEEKLGAILEKLDRPAASQETETLLICGSRTIKNRDKIKNIIEGAPETYRNVEKIIMGGANGVDTKAYNILTEQNEHLPDEVKPEIEIYEADWDNAGPAAGPIRNSEMVRDADKVLAIWDGKSNGTKDTIDKALNAGLDTYIKIVDPQ